MVEAKGLTKNFGSFTAVDNITFSVPRGEIFGFLGPNGAGKSTTFKMLCGLLKPTNGTGPRNRARFTGGSEQSQGAHLGHMAQKFSLYGNLNVRQNLDFFSGVTVLSGNERADAVRTVVEVFDLEPYLDAPAGNFLWASNNAWPWEPRLCTTLRFCSLMSLPPALIQ